MKPKAKQRIWNFSQRKKEKDVAGIRLQTTGGVGASCSASRRNVSQLLP